MQFEFINRGIGQQTSEQIRLRFAEHVQPLHADLIVLQLDVVAGAVEKGGHVRYMRGRLTATCWTSLRVEIIHFNQASVDNFELGGGHSPDNHPIEIDIKLSRLIG